MTIELEVRVDDGLRLAGSLLAAGSWPEREQALRPYKPHRVAEGAHRQFAAWQAYPAVLAAQALAGDPGAGSAASLFAAALACTWPADLAASLNGFLSEAQPAAYWARTQPDWQAAEAELRAVLARADLGGFLADMFAVPRARLAVFPNLLYPGRQALTVEAPDGAIWLGQPPPPAWGASPPWRYDERPDEVLSAVAESLARALVERALPAEAAPLRPHAALLALGAAVVFLRRAEGPAAGDQFMLIEQRARRLPRLPALVEAMAGTRDWQRWVQVIGANH
jgi:hypothetical protein